ncbi:uncharacterized protein LOC114350280 [Ostrinia furnacalis]|uniref:uncharacterized protein LOC114350280 n=1 Tax=Ostrinia furnacalis TaxID=93504 RepID=UPI00103E58E9|nr:uncharacterized protein LOC114350280 [Ostrinia furnacalis]
MKSSLAYVLAAYCLLYVLVKVDCSIVKPNNIPRIGRSDESAGPFDQEMGYVIKTNKNIPRMGRRNYDSGNRNDIPKFYQLPEEAFEQYAESRPSYNQEYLEGIYDNRLENMKK